MDNKVKSGKEVLDDFFYNIKNIENVDSAIAEILSNLYKEGKLSDRNVINALHQLKETDGNQD